MLDYLVKKPFLIYENCNMNKQLLFQVKWVQSALKNINFKVKTTRNVSFETLLWWPIYMIISVDKTKIILLYSHTDAAPQFL